MNAWHLRLALRTLRRGGLVLHATEGVWGFACDPFDAGAVERLVALKGRDPARGLIVIGADSAAFAAELEALDAGARAEVEGSWPGPVTWVLPNRQFPHWITGGRPTVAVRVPGHPQARALCRLFGAPLVSTSANQSGREPARRRLQAQALLAALDEPDVTPLDCYLLPGETLGRRGPSEIRTLTGERLRSAS